EATNNTTNPSAWTAFVQSGGASANGPVQLHGFALCAQPTSMTTPTPTPVVTPTPTPTPVVTPTPTPVPGATVTTTTLTVIRIPLPLGLGGIVIPIAQVAPANATGTVQFKDGSANLGAPVPVFAGIAIGPVSTLRPGSHSLSAVFTPTNPTKFQPSTSNTVTVTF
ncbi:MAG: Ig-like domain repeat protein, partial [Pseudonocardiales bacterium]|nr:Ig-like domain repeat protein [Pseudonocardiales bacterium]